MFSFSKKKSTASMNKGVSTIPHTKVVGEVMDSNLGPTRIIAKDVKGCTYCGYVRLIV